ncbi:MAG: DUF2911 domain-containing protein [Saprospiraceae bacterium]|uniref:DUF2911 domain-containing protein n=1 Tax=Candidatus Defluviibacterium haderslevense TaxID=2981993 RepID=A0A9D7S856_9BACT|nr:DUF2911 domain-containing protein [Candidatus Defluviibacterium haderslevense]MBK9717720.1 DUF2911 domain-containing protein [Candidatus Defluviibacterium haderslevense]
MNKLIFLFSFLMVISLTAQIQTPAPSPSCKLEQKLGLGTVTVEYSRPSVKNRKIFGEVVPFDKMWRTGANAATKITFSDDMIVEGKQLLMGTYALYTVPGEVSWQVIFYKDFAQSGLPKTYDPTKVALTVDVVPELLTTTVESFTIDINDLKPDMASLNLSWENTLVSVKMKTEIDMKVQKNIEKVLAGPTSDDYYRAASYYSDNNKDLNQALVWIQKANAMDAKFWKLRVESLILGKLGRKAEAIEAATKSKTLAAADGNEEYVKMNNEAIAEWSR